MTDTPPTQARQSTARGTSTASRSSSATATKPSTFNGTPAATTGVQAGLHAVEQLKYTVDQLQKELEGYNDSNVIGRDTILLRSYFDHGVGRFMQIAQALKINWTPPQVGANRR